MMTARIVVILIIAITIGCAHPAPKSSGAPHPKMAILSKLIPSQSTEQDVIRLLGKPAKAYPGENSADVVMAFDVISHPKHKFEFPMTTVVIEKKSRIVQGYNYYPYDGAKIRLANIRAAFPNANFEAEPVDLTHRHSIPATQILRDKKAGIRFEYRKSDDTVFGYFVSASANPSERIPATK